MTKIDFYQVDGDEELFTCRLIDMVYRRGHQVYVNAANKDQAEALDKRLWTFKDDAFVPHALCSESIEVPILIGCDYEPTHHQDVLVNLAGEIPNFFSRFDRVAEVVPLDQSSRQNARDNYAFYKARGYELDYHKMS